MLSPKRQKYRKQFRGTWRKIAIKGDKLTFGAYGLKAIKAGWVKDREIGACGVVLARATRKNGKYWIRAFPDKPYTKKPPEVTMGSGKGDVSHYVATVVAGKILFEIDGLPESEAKVVFKTISSKLPIKTRLINKI